MAVLSEKMLLTTAWTEVTPEAFVGQKDDKSTLLLTNADIGDTPPSDAPSFTEKSTDLFVYPAVAQGTWFARVLEGTGTLKIVKV